MGPGEMRKTKERIHSDIALLETGTNAKELSYFNTNVSFLAVCELVN